MNAVWGPSEGLEGDESEPMVLEAGLYRCKLSLVEDYIWIEKGDEKGTRGVVKTRVGRRAASKSLVRI